MAKKIKTYLTFHKGIINALSGKLIPDEALIDCVGFNTSKPGEITLLGDNNTAYGSVAETLATPCVPGYGLFLFHSDYVVVYDSDAGALVVPALKTSPTPTVENTILLIQDDAKTYIYDTVSDLALLTAIDLVGTTGDVLPCYINADGNIIICDGNFANKTSISKMLMYIKRTHFSGTSPGGAADDYDSWYVKNFELEAPTRLLAGTKIFDTTPATVSSTRIYPSAGSFLLFKSEIEAAVTATKKYMVIGGSAGTGFQTIANINSVEAASAYLVTDDITPDSWETLLYAIVPAAGEGFTIDITNTGSGGTFSRLAIGVLYCTFVYESEQESLPVEFNNSYSWPTYFSITASDSLTFIVYCQSPFDPKIVGARIYFKDRITGQAYSDDYYLLLDISLEKGIRKNLTDSYLAWNQIDLNPASDTVIGQQITVIDPTYETYYSINGYQADIDSITARYKTGVIANRSLYVGNVYVNGVGYGDRMMKSPQNKFSVLPSTSFLDFVVNDGESIVKLELFGDRILQYKQSNMYVINVAQSFEFLEASYKGAGVAKPCQTVATEFGVVSINTNGCWIFTNEGLKSLSDGKIDLSLLSWTDTPSIGYDFVRKTLVIYCGTATKTTDLVTGWNFTSGWLVGGTSTISIIDSNSFSTVLLYGVDWGGIYKDASIFTIGKMYTIRVAGTSTATSGVQVRSTGTTIQVKYIDLSTTNGVFDKTFTITAVDTKLYLFNSSAGITDITTLTVYVAQTFYEYNFVYDNWTIGTGLVNYPATNFVNDKDGALVYYTNYDTDKAYKHTDTAIQAVSGNQFITKDEFFDSPAIKKNIHKIVFHVKADTSQTMKIEYQQDNNAAWTTIESAYDIDTNRVYSVKSVDINAFDVYSIKFRFSLTTGIADTNFGFGSLSIYYTLKEPI